MKIVAVLPVKDILRNTLLSRGRHHLHINGHRFNTSNLKTFAIHGCACVQCGREGNQLMAWLDKGGGTHVDLFHRDSKTGRTTMLNRDHIIPKSKKGGNTNWNYQPMCISCNNRKGNNETHTDRLRSQFRHGWKKIYMTLHESYSAYVLRYLYWSPSLKEAAHVFRELHMHKISYALAHVLVGPEPSRAKVHVPAV